MVHLCIHNLGAVPEPLRESFFSKYSTVGKQGGTGLGTYSAALLAKAMAGTLSMETSDAAGTSLHLRLNVWAGPVAPAAVTRLQDSDETPDAANRRVLVVDDDEFNRMIAMERLSHTKAQVRSAVNGLDALEVVRSWRPDLIFMDIEMPVCDGHEALVGIRAFQTRAGQPRSLIVAFSGNDDAESRATYISQGFDECLTKPASQRAMFNLLRRSVDQPTDAT